MAALSSGALVRVGTRDGVVRRESPDGVRRTAGQGANACGTWGRSDASTCLCVYACVRVRVRVLVHRFFGQMN